MINWSNYIDKETGLLLPYPQHNILQVTGLALASGLLPDPIKGSIVTRYKRIKANTGFIPRTISEEWHEAMGKERKGDVWDQVVVDGKKIWINTAVSHSQLAYFLMGLWFAEEYDFCREICQQIASDGWRIKWRGKTVPNGKMTAPMFNLALKVLCMARIADVRAGWLAWRFASPWWYRWLKGDDLYGAMFWSKWGNGLGVDTRFNRGNDVMELLRRNLKNTDDADYLKNTLNYEVAKRWIT